MNKLILAIALMFALAASAATAQANQRLRCSKICEQTWAQCADAANKDFQWRWSFFRDADISISDRNAERRELNQGRREDLNACRSYYDSCQRRCDE
jgi:hypothetical protein